MLVMMLIIMVDDQPIKTAVPCLATTAGHSGTGGLQLTLQFHLRRPGLLLRLQGFLCRPRDGFPLAQLKPRHTRETPVRMEKRRWSQLQLLTTVNHHDQPLINQWLTIVDHHWQPLLSPPMGQAVKAFDPLPGARLALMLLKTYGIFLSYPVLNDAAMNMALFVYQIYHFVYHFVYHLACLIMFHYIEYIYHIHVQDFLCCMRLHSQVWQDPLSSHPQVQRFPTALGFSSVCFTPASSCTRKNTCQTNWWANGD